MRRPKSLVDDRVVLYAPHASGELQSGKALLQQVRTWPDARDHECPTVPPQRILPRAATVWIETDAHGGERERSMSLLYTLLCSTPTLHSRRPTLPDLICGATQTEKCVHILSTIARATACGRHSSNRETLTVPGCVERPSCGYAPSRSV